MNGLVPGAVATSARSSTQVHIPSAFSASLSGFAVWLVGSHETASSSVVRGIVAAEASRQCGVVRMSVAVPFGITRGCPCPAAARTVKARCCYRSQELRERARLYRLDAPPSTSRLISSHRTAAVQRRTGSPRFGATPSRGGHPSPLDAVGRGVVACRGAMSLDWARMTRSRVRPLSLALAEPCPQPQRLHEDSANHGWVGRVQGLSPPR